MPSIGIHTSTAWPHFCMLEGMMHQKIIFMSFVTFVAFQVSAMQPGGAPPGSRTGGTTSPFSSGGSSSGDLSAVEGGAVTSTDVADRIVQSAQSGAGSEGGSNQCYKAVKAIIARGLGKNLSCIRGILSGGAAKDALQDLPRAGFVQGSCSQEGSVHVYRGILNGRSGGNSPGDWAGHIEVKGAGAYYYGGSPVYTAMKDTRNGQNGRRTLVACFVPSSDIMSNPRVSRCGPGQGVRDPNRARHRRGRS